MTYCRGILVRDGLVMFADTRTNAGVDNISTFRKLHVFSKPGERIMAVASSGNLSLSQSVVQAGERTVRTSTSPKPARCRACTRSARMTPMAGQPE